LKSSKWLPVTHEKGSAQIQEKGRPVGRGELHSLSSIAFLKNLKAFCN
jgi:hypothetical protein